MSAKRSEYYHAMQLGPEAENKENWYNNERSSGDL